MNIVPTLERGLRLEVETDDDWLLLQHIAHDALTHDQTLGSRLATSITDPEMVRDWKDYVIADLDDQFLASVVHVTHAIKDARLRSHEGPGPLWIQPVDGFHWYSALNQARLTLDDLYQFGPEERIDPESMERNARAAWVRSRFYCALQSLMLEHVLG